MRENEALPISPNQFPGPELEYDELLILGDFSPRPYAPLYQSIINACGKSLKRLTLSPRTCMLQCVREDTL